MQHGRPAYVLVYRSYASQVSTRHMTPVGASLILCTRNRASRLDRCFEAIAAIEPPGSTPFEFILVDNGSTDGTRRVFERWRPAMPFPARYRFEAAPGTGNALNCGCRHSRGAILAFTDEVATRPPTSPARCSPPSPIPGIGVVGGRILLARSRATRPSPSRNPPPGGAVPRRALRAAGPVHRRQPVGPPRRAGPGSAASIRCSAPAATSARGAGRLRGWRGGSAWPAGTGSTSRASWSGTITAARRAMCRRCASATPSAPAAIT